MRDRLRRLTNKQTNKQTTSSISSLIHSAVDVVREGRKKQTKPLAIQWLPSTRRPPPSGWSSTNDQWPGRESMAEVNDDEPRHQSSSVLEHVLFFSSGTNLRYPIEKKKRGNPQDVGRRRRCSSRRQPTTDRTTNHRSGKRDPSRRSFSGTFQWKLASRRTRFCTAVAFRVFFFFILRRCEYFNRNEKKTNRQIKETFFL